MIETIATQSEPLTGRTKILVAYASQFGTTQEVAEAIGETLTQQGHAVDTKWVREEIDLQAYDAAVIGSAIQYDRWLPEATQFVQANQTSLSQMPVAYFFTCLTLAKRTAKTEQQALKYADQIRRLTPQVKPMDIGRFAGAITYRKITLPLRLILRVMMLFTGVKEGDYRDWAAIRTWARNISMQLTTEQQPVALQEPVSNL